MKIRRFIAVFLSALILCGVLTVPAAALEDPAIRAKAALLVEAETGTILYDKNIHDELSIASTTKIMSALLVFEAIDRGELRLDQQVTATATALRGLPEDGSTADILEGETLTVEQLLYCMLVISANETCNILGETLCGSVDAFVERMNQRAQELGCKNTHFANTTGLTQSGHYSSAYDLYLITREAMKHEDFMTMVNTKSYEIPPTNKTEEERVLHSTNALISNWRLAGYLYSGAQGIKTGSTDAAGQCLVSSAVRGSRTLISVVLGAEKVEKENGSGYIVESFTETARLFDWGFDNFAPQQVLDENELIQEVPVALSKQVSTVAVHPAESADAMLPKDLDVSALTRTVTLDNETALAPIAAGDRLGEITVSYGDTTYVTVPQPLPVPAPRHRRILLPALRPHRRSGAGGAGRRPGSVVPVLRPQPPLRQARQQAVPPPLLPRPPSLIWRLSVYSTRTRIWSSASSPWASCRRTAPPVPVCPACCASTTAPWGRTTISPPSTGWTGWWAALCCSPAAGTSPESSPPLSPSTASPRNTWPFSGARRHRTKPPSPTCCSATPPTTKATWSNVCGRASARRPSATPSRAKRTA